MSCVAARLDCSANPLSLSYGLELQHRYLLRPYQDSSMQSLHMIGLRQPAQITQSSRQVPDLSTKADNASPSNRQQSSNIPLQVICNYRTYRQSGTYMHTTCNIRSVQFPNALASSAMLEHAQGTCGPRPLPECGLDTPGFGQRRDGRLCADARQRREQVTRTRDKHPNLSVKD